MELIFREDAYAASCTATVTAVDERGIRLDRTVFYPNGGGQPGDTGALRFAGTALRIVDTVKGDGPDDVVHVPEPGAPLPAPADPVTATLAQVERQAVWFERAGLTPDASALLRAELDAARAFRCEAPIPVTLVGSDVHPGNFLIDAAGKAWFTDLEKAQYGHPAIDLAHASLYTSTKWEREVAAVLTPGEVADFHAAWEAAVPPALAEAVRPWRRPLRRLTWLRTLSWMARWRVEGAALSPDMPDSLAAHMDTHAADVLRPDVIERVAAEWRWNWR